MREVEPVRGDPHSDTGEGKDRELDKQYEGFHHLNKIQKRMITVMAVQCALRKSKAVIGFVSLGRPFDRPLVPVDEKRSGYMVASCVRGRLRQADNQPSLTECK